MKRTVEARVIADGTKEYMCGGSLYLVKSKSCFFCKHMSSLLWDYSNGIYHIFCSSYTNDPEGERIEAGLWGKCDKFEEVEEEKHDY